MVGFLATFAFALYGGERKWGWWRWIPECVAIIAILALWFWDVILRDGWRT